MSSAGCSGSVLPAQDFLQPFLAREAGKCVPALLHNARQLGRDDGHDHHRWQVLESKSENGGLAHINGICGVSCRVSRQIIYNVVSKITPNADFCHRTKPPLVLLRTWARNRDRLLAKQLSAAFVRAVNTPGKYHDEHGLILRVVVSERKQWISKSWVQRLVIRGRRRDLGLGAYPLVGLADARERALDNRRLARSGGDPRARPAAAAPTFEEAFEAVLAVKAPAWKSPTSQVSWRQTMRLYVFRTSEAGASTPSPPATCSWCSLRFGTISRLPPSG